MSRPFWFSDDFTFMVSGPRLVALASGRSLPGRVTPLLW
jgi:hypothetical protein